MRFGSRSSRARAGSDQSRFSTQPNFKSRIAGEVKGFRPQDYIEAKYKPQRMARHTQFAFAAMRMALDDAKYDPIREKPDHPIPIMMGVSTTAMDILQDCFEVLERKGPRSVNAGVLHCQPQAVTQILALALGTSAPYERYYVGMPVRIGCNSQRCSNDP